MRKLLPILSLFAAIALIGCEKAPSASTQVMLGGVNIAGTWANTEDPDNVSWYWTIDETHIGYYESDDVGAKNPSFKNGYIYNNGNNWILEMYPEYDIVGNSIFVSGLKLATITFIDANTAMMESSWLVSGRCERVKGFR